jgi:hypothetical protein
VFQVDANRFRLSVRVHGEVAMHVIPRFQIIVAPAIGPDPGRAQDALAGAEHDPDRFVV